MLVYNSKVSTQFYNLLKARMDELFCYNLKAKYLHYDGYIDKLAYQRHETFVIQNLEHTNICHVYGVLTHIIIQLILL